MFNNGFNFNNRPWRMGAYFLLLVCVFYFGFVHAMREHHLLSSLQNGGSITYATALTTWDDNDYYSRSHRYMLKAQIMVNDRVFEDTMPIGRDAYRTIRAGDRVLVTYLPNDPTQFRLGRITPRVVQSHDKPSFFAWSCLLIFLVWCLDWLLTSPSKR
jgi:hypothetical protein